MTQLTVEQFHALPRDEQDRLIAVARRAPVWAPLPGPQMDAFVSKADIIGYGGAAGGGKTDLAIGMALAKHHRTMIVRRTGPELIGIHSRIMTLLGGKQDFNGKDSIWHVQSGGHERVIEYGSTPNAGDETKYQGRPHDLLVFDEAVAFPRHVPLFLRTWLRHENPAQHCQMLLTFNPPTTAEGGWVVEFFGPWLDPLHPRPAKPGELRWYLTGADGKDREVEGPITVVEDGIEFRAMSRTFFPARVTDNPYYMASGYASQLYSLEEPFRSMMLKGSFASSFEDDPFQLFPSKWVDIAMARWKQPDVVPAMDAVGADIARGGRDKTVVFCRHGAWFSEPHEAKGIDTPDGPTAGAFILQHTRDRARIFIDIIGVGSSPYDWIRDLEQPIIGVNVSESAQGRSRSGVELYNTRTEILWRLREALDPAANNGIALPPNKELKRELAAFRWEMQGKKIRVDEKDKIVERLGRSPDMVSALALANMDAPDERALLAELTKSNPAAQMGHDPFVALDGWDYNPLSAM